VQASCIHVFIYLSRGYIIGNVIGDSMILEAHIGVERGRATHYIKKIYRHE